MARKSRKTITEADREIGRRIRLRRNMVGVTQEQLGRALGLTFQQVQKYEKGVNRVGSGRIQEIARFLKCPTSFFFDEMKNADDYPEASEFLAVHGAIEIARAYSQIVPASTRLAVLAFVQAVVKAQ